MDEKEREKIKRAIKELRIIRSKLSNIGLALAEIAQKLIELSETSQKNGASVGIDISPKPLCVKRKEGE
jgi:hypothetical protein